MLFSRFFFWTVYQIQARRKLFVYEAAHHTYKKSDKAGHVYVAKQVVHAKDNTNTCLAAQFKFIFLAQDNFRSDIFVQELCCQIVEHKPQAKDSSSDLPMSGFPYHLKVLVRSGRMIGFGVL